MSNLSFHSNIDGNLFRSGRLRSLSTYANRSQHEGGTPNSRLSPNLSGSNPREVIRTPPQRALPEFLPQHPRQYKRRVPRSPSPPVMPPIYTPLMEMGFSQQHIESAIESTGMFLTLYQTTKF